jgi:hypothetical protein
MAPFYRFVSDPISYPDTNPDSKPDPKLSFRIRIRFRPKVSDSYGSCSVSAVLEITKKYYYCSRRLERELAKLTPEALENYSGLGFVTPVSKICYFSKSKEFVFLQNLTI